MRLDSTVSLKRRPSHGAFRRNVELRASWPFLAVPCGPRAPVCCSYHRPQILPGGLSAWQRTGNGAEPAEEAARLLLPQRARKAATCVQHERDRACMVRYGRIARGGKESAADDPATMILPFFDRRGCMQSVAALECAFLP